jgi:hypothetical protein
MITGFFEIIRKGVPQLQVHTIPPEIYLLKVEEEMIQNNNFACGSVRVRNLVSNIKEGTQTEGV